MANEGGGAPGTPAGAASGDGGAFRPPEKIGFIGLGNMGAPMARNLAAAGYPLVVADAVPAAVERFKANLPAHANVEAPASLNAIGEACRVVITMLPEGNIVRTVLLGDNGVVSGARSGAIVIDMTSASPVGTRALVKDLAAKGITLVDAPVSGGVGRAIDGKLAIMAGGDTEVLDRCQPILNTMGQTFRTGPASSGHAMKALNNYLSAGALAMAAEAVLAGERFGLDPKLMIDIFNASTGRNTATDNKYPKFVLNRKFDSGFFLGLMAKDLRLALELAEDSGTPVDLLKPVVQMWSEAEQRLGFKADNTEIVKYLEGKRK
jgi:3-hydroxyisobutyrate dehydrogenase